MLHQMAQRHIPPQLPWCPVLVHDSDCADLCCAVLYHVRAAAAAAVAIQCSLGQALHTSTIIRQCPWPTMVLLSQEERTLWRWGCITPCQARTQVHVAYWKGVP